MPPIALNRPLHLPCGATLSNRIAKSAMSEQLGDRRGAPTPKLIELYKRWAESGAGLLVTGNVMVDARATNEPKNVVVEDERHLAEVARWAEVAQCRGVHAIVQIMHPGRQAPLARHPTAPSPVSLARGRWLFRRPRAMTDTEICDVVERFARCAELVCRAGFSGVQIHAAHGYLINQFLSPLANQRDDRWGGSAENRRRFLLEVVRAVRGAVGRRAIVAVKLNSADFQRGGFTHEESMDVIRVLGAEGLDLVEISGGTWESTAMFDQARESTRQREAYFLDYAAGVRAFAAMPVMVTGGFRTVAAMEAAVAAGEIDLVGLARPLAREPDLPRRLLDGSSAGARDVSLAFGVKSVDGFLETAWHQQQIRRIARGKAPDLHASRLLAVGRGIAHFVPMLGGRR